MSFQERRAEGLDVVPFRVQLSPGPDVWSGHQDDLVRDPRPTVQAGGWPYVELDVAVGCVVDHTLEGLLIAPVERCHWCHIK